MKKTKQFLSVFITLCMIISCMTGLTVTAGEEPDVTEVSTWTALQAALSEGGSVRLMQDVTAGENDVRLLIPEGVTSTLDLNGHTIDRGLYKKVGDTVMVDNPRSDGHVLAISGTFNLMDSSKGKTGKITGGNNTIDGACGGVTVYGDATFNMYGGSVTGNKTEYGGGVFIRGKKISDGKHYKSTFNMYGGTITGNTAGRDGGGVYLSVEAAHIFNMYGGTIADNTAGLSGGGVYIGLNAETFNMYGGTITGNTAGVDGGGVCSMGTFNMSGGFITGNTAGGVGGGVLGGDTFDMSGGFITGNTAGGDGGGVCSYGPYKYLSGSPVITGNKKGTVDNNVYVSSPQINLTGALNGNAKIGVTLDNPADWNIAFTTGGKVTDATIASRFVSDDDAYAVLQSGSEAKLEKKNDRHIHDAVIFDKVWTDANSLPSAASNYYLACDIYLNADWTVPGGTTNLCLNGHKIILNHDKKINVSGAILNLYDCNHTTHRYYDTERGIAMLNDDLTEGYKTFIGGYITDGTIGAISVSSQGQLGMYGGTIIGNWTAQKGGGVLIDSDCSFTMYDGNIIGNLAGNGGGVGVEAFGTFIMYGGNIIGNTAFVDGGGVAFDECMFTMCGGSITGNTAIKNGGGVYHNSGTNMQVYGTPYITGNLKGTGTNTVNSNVYIGDGKKITVADKLSEGAAIGVAMETPGVFTYGLSGKGTVDNFTIDDGNCVLDLNAGEAQLTEKSPAKVNVKGWTYGDYDETTNAPTLTEGSNPGNGAVTYKYKKKGAVDSTYTGNLPVNAGEYTVKAEIAAAGGCWARTATADFTIAKKEVTITWKENEFGYDGLAHCPTTSISGVVLGDSYETDIAVSAKTGSELTKIGNEYKAINKGEYTAELTINFTDDEDAGNYTIKAADKTHDFTINTITPVLTVSLNDWTYGDTAPAVVKSGNLGGGDEAISYIGRNATQYSSNKCPTDAGDYTIVYNVAATGNCKASSASGDFTVEQRTVGLSWGKTNLTYTGSEQLPTFELTNVKSGDTCTATVTGAQTIVGTDYIATVTALSNANYKLPGKTDVTFSIGKALQSSPAGVSSTNETVSGKADGTITGLTKGMEYRADTATAYTAVTGTTITGLAAGTYYVRYAADDNHEASADVTVVINNRSAITPQSDPVNDTPLSYTEDDTITNSDGSKTVTTKTLNEDGTYTEISVREWENGNKNNNEVTKELNTEKTLYTMTETIRFSKKGTKTIWINISKADGYSFSSIEKIYTSGKKTIFSTTVQPDKSKQIISEIRYADGGFLQKVMNTDPEGISTLTVTEERPVVETEGTTGSVEKTIAIYRFLEDGLAELVSLKTNSETVTIPKTVYFNGFSYKVVSIAKNAIRKNTSITTVIIGKNIRTIGQKAFYGLKNLKNIYINSKKIKTVGKKAFYDISKDSVFYIKAKESVCSRTAGKIKDAGYKGNVRYEKVK